MEIELLLRLSNVEIGRGVDVGLARLSQVAGVVDVVFLRDLLVCEDDRKSRLLGVSSDGRVVGRGDLDGRSAHTGVSGMIGQRLPEEQSLQNPTSEQ